MDITVTLRLEGGLQSLIETALAALPGAGLPGPAPEAASEDKKKRRKTAPDKAAEAPEPEPVAYEQEKKAPEQEPCAPAPTREYVLQFAREIAKTKREEVKKAVTDLGERDISSMPAEKFPALLEKLNAIR